MPHYPLDKIINAAKLRKIIYGGLKVRRDISNLNYTDDEVARCIAQLRPEHHQKIWTSKDKAAVFDVYAIDFLASENRQPDLIYIKLRLLENNQLWVSLGSFHL